MLNIQRFEGKQSELSFLIVSPHSSSGKEFLNRFPQIMNHPIIREKENIFKTYLRIERDFGAMELSCAIAHFLKDRGYTSIVCEIDYPRALLDGGRILSHCLRNPLPQDLLESVKSEWLKIHENSINIIDGLHSELNLNRGLLLDIHTMASYNPCQDDTKKTLAEHIDNLEQYCQQFIEAPKSPENLRQIDLIYKDNHGDIIGYPGLRDSYCKEFQRGNIPYVENFPYDAPTAFLMNRHMKNTDGIAIDVPKHLLAKVRNPENLILDQIILDFDKIEGFGRVFAKAAIEAFIKKGLK